MASEIFVFLKIILSLKGFEPLVITLWILGLPLNYKLIYEDNNINVSGNTKKNENSDEETIKQISNSFETLNNQIFCIFFWKKNILIKRI